MKTYSTITIESTNTFCIAYLDKYGIETQDSLYTYEARSEGLVNLFFVDTKKEAIELSKSL